MMKGNFRKALLILVAALPLLAAARKDRDDRARAFSEQVRADAQCGNEELRTAAQALLRANEAAARTESAYEAQQAVENFYQENPNGRPGGLVIAPGPWEDVDKKHFRQMSRIAAKSGQAFIIGSSHDVTAEEVSAAVGGTFDAEVSYQEARKNAGLSYNTDMEPYFRGSPHPTAPAAIQASTVLEHDTPMSLEAFVADIMPPDKAKPGSAAITLSSRIMGKHNRRQCEGSLVKGTFGAVSIRLGDVWYRPLLVCSYVVDCSRLPGDSRFRRTGYELCSFLYDLQEGKCVRWSGARTIVSETGIQDSPFSEQSSAERRSMQRGEEYEIVSLNAGGTPLMRKRNRYEIGGSDSLLFPDEVCYYRLEVWCGGAVVAVKEGTCNHARKPAGLPEDWFVPLHNREMPPFRKPFFSKVHLYPPGETFRDGEWPLDFR